MEIGSWPVPPVLGEEEVHLWWAFVGDGRELGAEERTWLAEPEIERAERFHRPLDRRRFVARAILRRGLLGSYLDRDPKSLRFREGPHGKPYLADGDGEGWSFNLSRSVDRVLFGITRGREVGVDVEAHRPLKELDSMAKRVFAPAEHAAYLRVADEGRRGAFYRIWTRKEAAMKALGEGFYREPRTLTVGFAEAETGRVFSPPDEDALASFGLADLEAPEDFSAAVCAPGLDWKPTVAGRLGG